MQQPAACSVDHCSGHGLIHALCVSPQVSALLVGDSHLSVLGRMSGLADLVLQGRTCSASDSGLLALSGLTHLNSLAISWVPWQSQITQVSIHRPLLGSVGCTCPKRGLRQAACERWCVQTGTGERPGNFDVWLLSLMIHKHVRLLNFQVQVMFPAQLQVGTSILNWSLRLDKLALFLAAHFPPPSHRLLPCSSWQPSRASRSCS